MPRAERRKAITRVAPALAGATHGAAALRGFSCVAPALEAITEVVRARWEEIVGFYYVTTDGFYYVTTDGDYYVTSR